MPKYIVQYGCYLDRNAGQECMEFETEADASQYANQLAYEETYGWVGMHGFCDEESFFEENPGATEAEYEEWVLEEVDYNAEGRVYEVPDDFEYDPDHWYEPEELP